MSDSRNLKNNNSSVFEMNPGSWKDLQRQNPGFWPFLCWVVSNNQINDFKLVKGHLEPNPAQLQADG